MTPVFLFIEHLVDPGQINIFTIKSFIYHKSQITNILLALSAMLAHQAVIRKLYIDIRCYIQILNDCLISQHGWKRKQNICDL